MQENTLELVVDLTWMYDYVWFVHLSSLCTSSSVYAHICKHVYMFIVGSCQTLYMATCCEERAYVYIGKEPAFI